MLILSGSSEKIQIVLGAAATTSQLRYTSSWGQLDAESLDTYGAGHGYSNDTTDVDVVSGVADKQVAVLGLSVYNSDTVPATVTVKKDVSGTDYEIYKSIIAAGETLIYERDTGFQVIGSRYMPVLRHVMHADAGVNFSMSNATQAERFAGNDFRHMWKDDLAGFQQVRILSIVRVSSASVNTPRCRLKYYTDYTTAVGNMLTLGASGEVEFSVAAGTMIDTGWIDLVAGARQNGIHIAFTEVGGDGVADPALGYTEVQFR